MNRRGFLASLLGMGAAAALDPERLLWVPGQKLISIPAPTIYSSEAVIVTMLEQIRPKLAYFLTHRQSKLLEILNRPPRLRGDVYTFNNPTKFEDGPFRQLVVDKSGPP